MSVFITWLLVLGLLCLGALILGVLIFEAWKLWFVSRRATLFQEGVAAMEALQDHVRMLASRSPTLDNNAELVSSEVRRLLSELSARGLLPSGKSDASGYLWARIASLAKDPLTAPCCMDQSVNAVIAGAIGLMRCGRNSGVPSPACGSGH